MLHHTRSFITTQTIVDKSYQRHRLYDVQACDPRLLTGFLLPLLAVFIFMTSNPSLPRASLACLTARLSPGMVTPLRVPLSLTLFSGSTWQYGG